MQTTESKPLVWKPVPRPVRVPLLGNSVTLEPLDAVKHSSDLWEAVRGHDGLWTWMPDGPFATEEALRESVAAKQAADGAVFMAIVPKALGVSAGYASYMRIEAAHGVVEVGNIMMAPSLQRTVAATEAMYLMAKHIFDDLGYRRYEWKCNAGNAPSRRAALRYGFAFEGIFRQHMVVKGLNRDTAWFAMLDSDWPAIRRAFEAWLAPGNFDANGRQIKSLAELRG